MRVVPRANDAINETWIADRDRFSCEGFYAPDRARQAAGEEDGTWREVDWETALEAAANGLRGRPRAGRSPGRGAGLADQDARGTRAHGEDSRAASARTTSITACAASISATRPTTRGADARLPIAELEQASGVLVVGSNVRKEVPLIAHRLARAPCVAARRSRSSTARSTSASRSWRNLTSNGYGMAQHLAAVFVAALRTAGRHAAANVAAALEGISPNRSTRPWPRARRGRPRGRTAGRTRAASRRRTPRFARWRGVGDRYRGEARVPARGRQRRGRRLAGALPHRAAGGRPVRAPGLTRGRDARRAPEGLRARRRHRGRGPAPSVTTEASLKRADCVVAITPYASEEILDRRERDPAERGVRRDLRHLGQRRGRWQSVRGRRAPRGRGASGLEGPARARQSARPRGASNT